MGVVERPILQAFIVDAEMYAYLIKHSGHRNSMVDDQSPVRNKEDLGISYDS